MTLRGLVAIARLAVILGRPPVMLYCHDIRRSKLAVSNAIPRRISILWREDELLPKSLLLFSPGSLHVLSSYLLLTEDKRRKEETDPV